MLNRKLAGAFTLLLCPTGLLAVIGVLCMMWHRPTRVELDVTTIRATFIVGGTQHLPLFNTLPFKSITIQEFSSIVFSPASFYAPAAIGRALGRASLVRSHAGPSELRYTITPGSEELQPSVNIEGAEAPQPGGLRSFEVNPGSVVDIEVSEARHACLRIKSGEVALSIGPPSPFCIDPDHCFGEGAPGSFGALKGRLCITRLSGDDPNLRVRGNGRSLLVCMELIQNTGSTVSLGDRIPVTGMGFDQSDTASGYSISALRKGEISYPDFPKVERVLIGGRDFLRLERLKDFNINEVSLSPDGDGLFIRLAGIADGIKCGPEHFDKDRRLTAFDWLWQDSKTTGLFGIIVWVFATTLGARRLYMELKR